MLAGWLKSGLDPKAVLIIDPFLESARKLAPAISDTSFFETVSDLAPSITPSFVILAVKPQILDDALTGFGKLDNSETVFISVAAGKTLSYFENILGKDKEIVRAMPNLPATIGRGITVGCCNQNVTKEHKDVCHILLEAVGQVEWITDEGLIDAVTALSGSGPAYIFYLAETMEAAGIAVGLSPELAKKLAIETISGAGELLRQSHLDASQLRRNVTSPNGTTAAALEVLMQEDGLKSLINGTIRAAHHRSKELAD